MKAVAGTINVSSQKGPRCRGLSSPKSVCTRDSRCSYPTQLQTLGPKTMHKSNPVAGYVKLRCEMNVNVDVAAVADGPSSSWLSRNARSH